MNGKLPEWISDFAEGFSKKNKTVEAEETIEIVEAEEAQQEVTAVINLKDLPTVPWNDEIFYIVFNTDKNSATLYNEFGMVIKDEIENVSTVDEINNFLNSMEVVVAEEEEIDQSIKENNINCPICNRNLSNCDCEMESLEDKINKVDTIMELTAKVSTLENKISELSNEITAIKAQEYARTNPENIYSTDVPSIENKHFEEMAKATEEKIESDNSIDITTPKGRVSLPLTQKTIEESYETPSDEVDKMSYNRDENIKKLSSIEVNLFKTATCPSCNGKLIKANSTHNMIGVYCSDCDVEYAVNLNNEDIYQKI